jgi:hypothetical protein
MRTVFEILVVIGVMYVYELSRIHMLTLASPPTCGASAPLPGTHK